MQGYGCVNVRDAKLVCKSIKSKTVGNTSFIRYIFEICASILSFQNEFLLFQSCNNFFRKVTLGFQVKLRLAKKQSFIHFLENTIN